MPPSAAITEPAPKVGALKRLDAAKYLGVGSSAFAVILKKYRDGDPRQIRRTSYGTYPIAELNRHLAAEIGGKEG